MTTIKTYSKANEDETSSNEEYDDKVDYDRSRRNAADDGMDNGASILNIYGLIKERTYSSFTRCFMENSSYTSFIKLMDPFVRVKYKKMLSGRCRCCNSQMIQCKNFGKWKIGHERLLVEIYKDHLSDKIPYNDWLEYAYKTSSICGCYAIETADQIDFTEIVTPKFLDYPDLYY